MDQELCGLCGRAIETLALVDAVRPCFDWRCPLMSRLARMRRAQRLGDMADSLTRRDDRTVEFLGRDLRRRHG